ncbi:MAG: hypothetical protein AB7V45_00825 [Candidatus Krumholzibacteriia bacterium]
MTRSKEICKKSLILNVAGGGSCDPPPDLSGFTWSAVFPRVERVRKDLLGTGA